MASASKNQGLLYWNLKLNITHSPTAMWENVFLLTITAAMKIALTAWTFGIMVNICNHNDIIHRAEFGTGS